MARPRTTGKPKATPPRTPPKAPRQRDPKTGKYLGKEAAMRANSYEAFQAWYDDRQPRILTKGRYEHVALTRKQESTLRRILQNDGKGASSTP